MVSNSIGVKRPRAAYRRRWQVRAIEVTSANRSSPRLVEKRRLRTFFCSWLKKLFIAASSPHDANLPTGDKAVAGQNAQEHPASKLRSAVAVNHAAGISQRIAIALITWLTVKFDFIL